MTGKTHMTAGLGAGIIFSQVANIAISKRIEQYGMTDNKYFTFTNVFSDLTSNQAFNTFFSMPIIIFILFSIIGSLFPDIDHKKSKMGKTFKPISYFCNKFLGHRGVIHSFIFYGILYLLITFLYKNFVEQEYFYLFFAGNLGFFIGAISHLFLDTLNKTGIPWFYPITKKKFHIATILTGSVAETIFCTFLWIFIAFYFIFLFNPNIFGIS